MGRVQNCNLYIKQSSHEKLLVILCIGSTDLVKVAIVLKYLEFFFQGLECMYHFFSKLCNSLIGVVQLGVNQNEQN